MGAKIQSIFQKTKKNNTLIINILSEVQGASYIYKYILAPCTTTCIKKNFFAIFLPMEFF